MSTLVLLLAFVAIAILVWKIWKPVVKPPKREVPANEARLYFFYTEWCGFSQKAQPEWAKLEQALSKTGYFGTTHVTPVKVDAETDQKTATLYDIQAYPSVLLETKTGIIDFDQRVTAENLLTFLQTRLGEKRESL
jgi:thiol-disulfide isomerase/thioredoxin